MKILKIENLKEFLEIEFENSFEILYNLEKEVRESNKVFETILIPYKEYGDVIFDLKFLVLDNNFNDKNDFIDMDFEILDLRNFKDIVITYNYSTTVS